MLGLSLVELMIAITLGLLLLSGVIAVLVNTSRSHEDLLMTSRLIENGRYALHVLGTEIRLAGFYGQYYKSSAPASLPSPCDTGLTALKASLGLPIQGFAGATADPLGCLPGDGSKTRYVPNTDVLVVRRAATVATPFDPDAIPAVDRLIPLALYLQSIPTDAKLNCAAAAGNGSVFTFTSRDRIAGQIRTVRAPVRRYLMRIYYIRPCSDCTGNGDGIPTLTCLELRDPLPGETQCPILNTNAPTPIAEGVENLQVRYGLDTSLDGAPDSWVANPATVSNWSNAVAVELNLLVRGLDPVLGYSDSKTYALGDVTVVAPRDQRKRHVFSSVFRAVNPSSRREQ
jgi:type IV pilus assembly protein PilW